MSSNIRKAFQVTLAAVALGAGAIAWPAGVTGKIARETREEQRSNPAPARSEQPRNEQPRRNDSPARSEQPRRSEQPARTAPQSRPDSARSGVVGGVVRGTTDRNTRPAPRVESPPATASQGSSRGSTAAPATSGGRQGNSRGNDARGNNDRGVLGTIVRDQQRDNDRDRGNGRDWDRDTNPDRDRGDRRDAWRDRDRDYDRGRRHRHVHVVHHLPSGYRDYWWNGSRYYYHDGYWYRPQGGTYITVGIPYGLFVTSLPGAYTSFWFGNTRYFYSDYHYYTYEPAQRGYVVVRSPYGDDYDYVAGDTAEPAEDLYIYPAQGQSEQQQADDRYECHRWAVSETDYDPIDDEYDADLREDYLRALTACLTGRGYTVR
jgi:hypothetical protein